MKSLQSLFTILILFLVYSKGVATSDNPKYINLNHNKFDALKSSYPFVQKDSLNTIVPYFTCPSDSVTYYFFKNSNQISKDTIVSTNFSNYNKIGDKSGISINYIFTKIGRKTKVRVLEGCRRLEKDSTYTIDDTKIFDYYFENNLNKIEGPIDSWLSQSHDAGFLSKVYINGKQVNTINVRNHQFITKPNHKVDKRVTWTKMIKIIYSNSNKGNK